MCQLICRNSAGKLPIHRRPCLPDESADVIVVTCGFSTHLQTFFKGVVHCRLDNESLSANENTRHTERIPSTCAYVTTTEQDTQKSSVCILVSGYIRRPGMLPAMVIW